jgi:predicted PurR-regulated permease PerM
VDARIKVWSLTERPTWDAVSLAAAVVALYAVLQLELLAALLAGLLVAQLVHATAPLLTRLGVANDKLGKAIALILVAAVVTVAVGLAVLAIWRLTAGTENLSLLMQRMAEVIGTARNHLPPWASEYLPGSITELQAALSRWLRENAHQLQFVGRDVAITLTQIVVGMIIGGMIAYTRDTRVGTLRPLAAALEARALTLGGAFRGIVFSQIRISALNTTLTAIYLGIVLPLLGIDLPFLKLMIAITFIVGLLPVIGNLISNTVIVLVSLSVSPWVAAGSLAFLVFIHKLEYFVNARIIGGRINARAWELLLAMLVMDAWFGIPGLIAAPIYYAYFKRELTQRELI